jgi:hypothetical protein
MPITLIQILLGPEQEYRFNRLAMPSLRCWSTVGIGLVCSMENSNLFEPQKKKTGGVAWDRPGYP